MRRTGGLFATVALTVLLVACGANDSEGGAANPEGSADKPDPTDMVNGMVRAFAQVGDNLWVGGQFTEVHRRNGVVIADVSNVAVFDAETGAYKPGAAPVLGADSADSKVTELEVYEDPHNGQKYVVAGGKFAGPNAAAHNLVAFDGATGQVVRWFDSGTVESVLAASDLGTVYAGGGSLSAFDFANGEMQWKRAKATVDPALRPTEHVSAGYRDLERDGQTIWAACACDAITAPDGTTSPAKALVKLDTEGSHDASWVAHAEVRAFGHSLVQEGENLYLAAGGSDFLAQYPKASGGTRGWERDTSGSAQVVEVADGRLVVGGHFWEVADESGDWCGHRSADNAETLDPDEVCQTRRGLAAYSFGGALQPWAPVLAGKYELAWALHPEATDQGTRLHVGGNFLTVGGVEQAHYARLSEASGAY